MLPEEPRNLSDLLSVTRELAVLRERSTPPAAFRASVRRLSTTLVGYVIDDDALKTTDREVTTPLEVTKARALCGPVALVPVMRAGLGMLEAALDLLPEALVWHLGLRRVEDGSAVRAEWYYENVPSFEDVPSVPRPTAIVLDPMLATGGSAVAACTLLKNRGIREILYVSVLAAPEGLRCVAEAHPDVVIYVWCVDRCLNGQAYILPGLGDAGDRQYPTR